MKILELADLIERCNDCKYNQDAATMIRKLEGQLAFRIDAVTKYQAWVQELEISKQSWEIIAKGYGKTIDEQQVEIEALKLCCPTCGGVSGISEVLNHQVKELKIHEDIVYGLAYKHRIEKGDVQGFAMELLRKAQEK
mgnify:FL=1